MVFLPVNSESPYYSFKTRLDGNAYRLTLRFNVVSGNWYLDIEGTTNSVSLLGLALICGSDLLRPYAIRELGRLTVYDLGGGGTNPTRDSLGRNHVLAYFSPGEVVADVI